MSDDKETPVEPVAPANDEAQAEQAVPADEGTQAPDTAAETAEKLYAGKYKSVEEMEKAYTESQSKLTQLAQEKAELERYTQQISQQVPEEADSDILPLDEASEKAVRALLRQEREQERIDDARRKTDTFLANHPELKSNVVLSGTLGRLINEEAATGREPNHEALLQKAQEMVRKETEVLIKQAQVQGEQEGSKVAQDKARYGSVGQTASPQKLDEDSLTADEWAKLKGIPRVSGE